MSASVLPARAGMSPIVTFTIFHEKGAPRTGGDEPQVEVLSQFLTECSPHGRG